MQIFEIQVLERKQNIIQAVEMLKVLSHPLRLSILCGLVENEEMTVGEIGAAAKGYSQSQISQYLGMLREMGYVSCRKEGQTVRYRLSSKAVKTIMRTLHDLYCSGKK